MLWRWQSPDRDRGALPKYPGWCQTAGCMSCLSRELPGSWMLLPSGMYLVHQAVAALCCRHKPSPVGLLPLCRGATQQRSWSPPSAQCLPPLRGSGTKWKPQCDGVAVAYWDQRELSSGLGDEDLGASSLFFWNLWPSGA